MRSPLCGQRSDTSPRRGCVLGLTISGWRSPLHMTVRGKRWQRSLPPKACACARSVGLTATRESPRGAFVANPALDEFDWMRQVRNATEYPDLNRPTSTAQVVSEAIEAAGAIVASCVTYVVGRE